MGHGFRKDLSLMLAKLKPQFLKSPGGNYVMGNYLRNAFQWSEIVGPWEERPGNFNDAWGYWTYGLGLFEFLQLAEYLGASPVWVVSDDRCCGWSSHQKEFKASFFHFPKMRMGPCDCEYKQFCDSHSKRC